MKILISAQYEKEMRYLETNHFLINQIKGQQTSKKEEKKKRKEKAFSLVSLFLMVYQAPWVV